MKPVYFSLGHAASSNCQYLAFQRLQNQCSSTPLVPSSHRLITVPNVTLVGHMAKPKSRRRETTRLGVQKETEVPAGMQGDRVSRCLRLPAPKDSRRVTKAGKHPGEPGSQRSTLEMFNRLSAENKGEDFNTRSPLTPEICRSATAVIRLHLYDEKDENPKNIFREWSYARGRIPSGVLNSSMPAI